MVVTSEGTWLGGDITTTAKTLATVHDDPGVRQWFYPALAQRLRKDADDQREFLRRLDTPGRVVIELEPVDWITYDDAHASLPQARWTESLRGAHSASPLKVT